MATWIGTGAADPNDDIKVGDHKVGIGTTSPGDSLEIKGNLATIPSADAYPTLQILDYTHDNVSINFDSYYRSGWKSSDSGSNFRIYKVGDSLRFSYASGVSQGSTISNWASEDTNCAMVINTSSQVGIGTTDSKSKLHVNGSISLPIVTKTSDYTASDNDFVIRCNCNSGNMTITLQKVDTCPGRVYILKKVYYSNTVSISVAAGDSISDGVYALFETQTKMFLSDGSTTWHVIFSQ